ADEPHEGPPVYSRFEKDWCAQAQWCGRLAAGRGYRPAGTSVFSARQPSSPRLLEWADSTECEVVVVASERILGRMRQAWPDWGEVVERLAAVGVRIEAAPFPEPVYAGEEPPRR